KKSNIQSDLEINSANAMLIKIGSDKIIFEKNSTEKVYPASVTKIMTALIVLSETNNLDEEVTLQEEMFVNIYNENAATAGFLPNETVSIKDLLYGLLLPSGAECAVGLAEHIAGSESDFAELMNEKASELEMNNTHFTNATGLHDSDHYTTVSDLTVLLKYALQNKTFKQIFTTSRHTCKPTSHHADGITFHSTLFSHLRTPDFKGGTILGGKTGYTNQAGQCLASLAEKDGELYILVTCSANGDHKKEDLHIDDALKIYRKI
ncbi:MAG: serine hydrolase, partial [Lachnoclostridium sp.]|nr:serine hydrolase [Lachnoclostridium sp.]